MKPAERSDQSRAAFMIPAEILPPRDKFSKVSPAAKVSRNLSLRGGLADWHNMRSSLLPQLRHMPLLLLFLLFGVSDALFFFLDSMTPKCFFEELPKDTLVVGT